MRFTLSGSERLMAKQLVADVKWQIFEGVQNNILVGLLPIYPKMADLLSIPDMPAGSIAPNAAYLSEMGLIFLDSDTDLSRPDEILARLTASGVDKAITVVRNSIARLSAPYAQLNGVQEEPDTVFILTPFGEPDPEPSEG